MWLTRLERSGSAGSHTTQGALVTGRKGHRVSSRRRSSHDPESKTLRRLLHPFRRVARWVVRVSESLRARGRHPPVRLGGGWLLFGRVASLRVASLRVASLRVVACRCVSFRVVALVVACRSGVFGKLGKKAFARAFVRRPRRRSRTTQLIGPGFVRVGRSSFCWPSGRMIVSSRFGPSVVCQPPWCTRS